MESKTATHTEYAKALADDFLDSFTFVEELLRCESSGEFYLLKDVRKEPRPCLINGHTVYLVQTDTGKKGIAIVEWPANENTNY